MSNDLFNLKKKMTTFFLKKEEGKSAIMNNFEPRSTTTPPSSSTPSSSSSSSSTPSPSSSSPAASSTTTTRNREETSISRTTTTMKMRKTRTYCNKSLKRFQASYHNFRLITGGIPYVTFTVSFGLLVDMATYGILVPVLPFRLTSIGYHHIPARSSYLIAAFAVGLIISSVPIGILGEVVKARKIPLLICLGFLIGSLTLFWLSTSFPLLVISRILQGISGTGIWTLGLALICDVVPEELIGAVMGYVMIGWSIGTVVGPLAGGLLYDSLGYHSIFIFALSLTALDFVFRLLVQDPETSKRENGVEGIEKAINTGNVEAGGTRAMITTTSTSMNQKEEKLQANVENSEKLKSMNQQSTTLISHSSQPPLPLVYKPPSEPQVSTSKALLSLIWSPRCWTLFMIIFVLGFSFGGLLDAGMTLIVHKRYELNARGAALIFLGAVVPSFASSPLAGHFADKYGARFPITACLILGTPFFGLLSVEGSLSTFILWLALTGLFVMGIAAPIMQDLANVVKVTPGLGYAHVYSIFNMVYSTGALIGPLVVGGVFERAGIERGWKLVSLICATMCILCIPPTWLFVGDKRKMTVEQQQQESLSNVQKPEAALPKNKDLEAFQTSNKALPYILPHPTNV